MSLETERQIYRLEEAVRKLQSRVSVLEQRLAEIQTPVKPNNHRDTDETWRTGPGD